MTVAPRREPLRFHELAEVFEAVRRDGGRLSLPRRQVLEALFAADGLVSAEQIAAGMHTGVEIEVTSVYRNLERLEQLGVIRHVHIGHGPGLYGLSGHGDAEYLVCEHCGTVTTLAPSELDDVRALIHAKFGLAASFDHFPLHGVCADCESLT